MELLSSLLTLCGSIVRRFITLTRNGDAGFLYCIPSGRPSVCRRHGFRSITQVCFGVSISNSIYAYSLGLWTEAYLFWAISLSKWASGSHVGFFGFRTLVLVLLWISCPNLTGTSLVCMGRSLLSFSKVTLKMAAWWPYWNFRYLERDSSLLWNFNFKFHTFWFPDMSLPKWPPGGHIGFFRTLTLAWLWTSSPNFSSKLLVCMERSLLIFINVTFKMAAWRPVGCFSFRILTSIWLWISRPNFSSKFLVCLWWSLLIFSNVTFKMAACV